MVPLRVGATREGEAVTTSYADVALYKRLLHLARPYWTHISGILLLSLLSAPLALLTPLPLKIVVDSVIGSDPLPRFLETLLPRAVIRSNSAVLAVAISLLVGVTLLDQLQGQGSTLLRTYTSQKLILNFRAHLFGYAQRLSLSYHDLKGTSDSIYRIQYDSSAIQYIAIDGVIPFLTSTLTFISMVYVTFRLDVQLALVALAVSPALFMITRVYRRNLRKRSRQVKKLESAALSVVQEALTSVRIVKAFGQEDRERERFVRHSREGMRARLCLALAEGGLGLLLGLTIATGTASVLLFGVRHVQAGTLTLGELLLVMGYLSQLYSPLKTMSRKMASLQSHLASAERAFALLDEAPDVPERPNARPIGRASGSVELHNVSFGYEEGHPVLQDVHYQVPAGMHVGIVGETGAGKTTLLSLLVRFYDPTSGQILLDGVDLRDYRLVDLRDQFAIVLQEPVLFSTSIAENIAYARPDASEEEIVQAARAANAHDFIVSLPEGYESLVGERGMRLSGGERQRIALARAFLKDAPILILDEPTSSVDMATEADIMEAMNRLAEGRTTFMIAHRLTTLRDCDALVRIEGGRLLEMTPEMVKVQDAVFLERLGHASLDRVANAQI